MKTITIHQPEHLPYLGFFHKVSMCDELVLLDNVRYEKNYFQHRNRIYTSQGASFITVPVTNTHQTINEVTICDTYFARHCRKNVRTIEEAYKNAPYFKKYGDSFMEVYTDPNFYYLSTYNESLLHWILNVLEIEVKVTSSSEMGATGAKTDLIVDICNKVGADKYISGIGGLNYLEKEKFSIPVEFQRFNHPVYTQWGRKEFQPCMSMIDAIFNVGPEIMNIIRSANNGKRK